jgi:nucleoside-diphosphate-sugar epimerase
VGRLAGSRVLVTGATGFVGANLVRRLLAEGAHIYAMLRPDSDVWRLADIASQIHWMKCDLHDFSGVSQCISSARPDIIYHSAFPGGHDSDISTQLRMLSDGLLGTCALLEAANKNHVKRFIHIGSSTEYHPGDRPHREDELIRPVSIRGVGKAASTLLCQQYAQQYKMNIVILRLFSVYGRWEQQIRLIPVACKAIMYGRVLPLTLPGLMHDWVFVDDVMDACVRVCSSEFQSGEIINIGSGEQHPNEEIVRILGEVAERAVKVDIGGYEPRVIDTVHWVADISKAREILGWVPGYSLRTGLTATYQFWSDWNSQPGRESGD